MRHFLTIVVNTLPIQIFRNYLQVISKLDLIITVDHLVAHLAGALNIDTILMLPCVPNWRWDMNFRDTSVWYKSFKVIRQQTPGDWTLVMSKLSNHLSGLKNG